MAKCNSISRQPNNINGLQGTTYNIDYINYIDGGIKTLSNEYHSQVRPVTLPTTPIKLFTTSHQICSQFIHIKMQLIIKNLQNRFVTVSWKPLPTPYNRKIIPVKNLDKFCFKLLINRQLQHSNNPSITSLNNYLKHAQKS